MSLRPSVLVLLVALVVPASATAAPKNWVFDQEDSPKKFDLSLLGTFDYDRSVGGSAILGIAIVPKGFIPDKNDAFFIEIDGGASYRLPDPGNVGHGSAYVGGGVRYQVHLLTWLAPYVAVRGGARFWFDPQGVGRLADPYVSGAIGAFFYTGKVFAFRVEVGFPGARAGISFYF